MVVEVGRRTSGIYGKEETDRMSAADPAQINQPEIGQSKRAEGRERGYREFKGSLEGLIKMTQTQITT